MSDERKGLDQADLNFTEALLEVNFATESHVRHVGELVNGVMGQIDREFIRTTRKENSGIRHRTRLKVLSAVAATLLIFTAAGLFFFGSAKSAQATVMEVLANTLSAGPRKYDATFTISGPVLGMFQREGSFFVDGSNRFRAEIPSPWGIESRVWTFGNDGEKPWAVLPSGRTWQGSEDQLRSWWDERGQGDLPVLHVEAVLRTLGETYQLSMSTNERGETLIRGSESPETPPRWANEIELVIDPQTGFAKRIDLKWTSGRLRQIELVWNKDIDVSQDAFEIETK